MKAEGITIIEKIQAVFTDSRKLSFFNGNVYTFEDELALIDKGVSPYMNLVIQDVKITAADNMDIHHVERHRYPIQLFYSNRHLQKSIVSKGDEATGFKGLFDIHDLIREVIMADPTFGDTVKDTPSMSDTASTIFKYQSGKFWIGRALMMFEVYKDITMKK